MQAKLSFEAKIGILALLVSIFAICISSYQTYLQRMQTYASVMPRLDMFTQSYYYENAKEVNLCEFKIGIKNSGVGPANIDTFTVKVDDEVYRFFDEPFRKIAASTDFEISSMWKNRMITSNESIFMISTKGKSAKKLIEAFQKDNKSKLEVKVLYSSIYGEQWEFNWSNFNQQTTVKK